MRKRLLSAIIAVAFSLSLVLGGCGSVPAQTEKDAPKEVKQEASADKQESSSKPEEKKETKKIKAGFIYLGPIGDGGWNLSHDLGRLYLEDQLKGQVETVYKENVSDQNADCVNVIRDMIDQGCTLIVGTSFGYMDHMEKLSKEFPKIKFLHCSGYKTTENMSAYFVRVEEARYLTGIAAGMKTKTNKIAYIVPLELPLCIRQVNGFALGVKSVNPKAQVIVKWTHTWYDPAKEKEAAKAALDEGCDVTAQEQDSTAVILAAQEKGVFAIGHNTDTPKVAPKAYITSSVYNWGPYYVKQAKAIMDGTWKSENYWEGIKDQGTDIAPLTDLAPAGAKEKIEEVRKKIIDGSFNIFSGPIKDQSGKSRAESGKAISDEDQQSMDWFVDNVVGKIEKAQ